MISVLWYHTPPEPKQINGTYWMHWKADMYELKSEFKELFRLRKNIGDSSFDLFLQSLIRIIVLHIPMFILNAIATSYLVWRIFVFCLGIIKDQATTKKNGWWKCGNSRWKKDPDKQYHVHATVLNIDNRANRSSSHRFDSDSVTVISENSANVHVSNTKSCSVGEIKFDKSLKVATIGGRQNPVLAWVLFVESGKMTMDSSHF